MLPEEQRLRIGHEILIHLDAQMVDLADDLLVEQRADVTDGRALDVVVAEGRDLAGFFRRRRHGLGFGEDGAIGFSHHRCLPASRMAMAISGWNWLGVVKEMTSTSGR